MEETTRKDGKRGKAEKGLSEQQTLFQAGLLGPNTLQAEISTNLFILIELEEVG